MVSSFPFPQVGGRLAVDFANTLLASDVPHALTWPRLIQFLESAKIVSHERAARLLALAETDPPSVDVLVRKAETLRLAIREVFDALIHNRTVPSSRVEIINAVLRITEGHDELILENGSMRLAFVARENGSEWLLAAIARSAAEIACDGASERLRKCANHSCGLFFYDSSRTHRRRWCSMALCGNRHKVAAFARRQATSRRSH